MVRRMFLPVAKTIAPCLLLMMPGVAAAQAPEGHFDAVAMFVGAVPMVKGVMILLILASVASWALFVVKARDIAAGVRSVDATARRIRDADRLDDVTDADPVIAAMIGAARLEMDKSAALARRGRIEGMCERIDDQLIRIDHAGVARMRQGLPVFASIGSVAPFVGLFGTVWGIMHSFAGIATAKSTSLAVVAPGISEALLATALGLVAAIPATVMYNLLGRRMAHYRQSLGDGAALLSGLVGRELEMIAFAASGGMPDRKAS